MKLITIGAELWVKQFFVCRHVSIWGFQNRVCPYPEKRNHPGIVNISPKLVIDTSMERSSRVLNHDKSKIWFYEEKTLDWVFLLSCFVNNFQLILCTLIGAIILSINIKVGLNMRLYDDIEDASSSFRGNRKLLIIFLQIEARSETLS